MHVHEPITTVAIYWQALRETPPKIVHFGQFEHWKRYVLQIWLCSCYPCYDDPFKVSIKCCLQPIWLPFFNTFQCEARKKVECFLILSIVNWLDSKSPYVHLESKKGQFWYHVDFKYKNCDHFISLSLWIYSIRWPINAMLHREAVSDWICLCVLKNARNDIYRKKRALG